MSRRYLRSDMSTEEASFFLKGEVFCGEENCLAYLFKFVGKYVELKKKEEEYEIRNYLPKEDRRFKYENAGYTFIGNLLREEDNNYYTSRKNVVKLCRKWRFTRVVISFESGKIIHRLFRYINEHVELRRACKDFLEKEVGYSSLWIALMPIQADFISTRNDDQHKNYKEAERLIKELAILSL